MNVIASRYNLPKKVGHRPLWAALAFACGLLLLFASHRPAAAGADHYTLTIVKQAWQSNGLDPHPGPWSFDFTCTSTYTYACTPLTLTNVAPSHTFHSITQYNNTVTITETVPTGWTAAVSCRNQSNVEIASGTNSITLTSAIVGYGDQITCTFSNIADPPPSAPDIFMSTTVPGTTADGLAFGSEDIIKWDGSAWSMWFDGSAAGLAPTGKWKHNINAFWIPDPDDDDAVMSFTQNRRLVPGIAGWVDGMDLVHWDGSAFSLWFDGEDVGLTNMTQEKIDALHVLPGSASPIGGSCLNYLLISTQGTGRVANYDGTSLRFRGEDVLGFCMTNGGSNTTGFWHMVLDGSAQGMPPNATDSISMSADGQTMYLTTRHTFNVDSASGGHSMVYAYDFGTQTFSGPLFIAADNGLPKTVDGLQME